MAATNREQNSNSLTSVFNYIGTLISGFFSSIWQFFAGGNNTESKKKPVETIPTHVINGQSGAEKKVDTIVEKSNANDTNINKNSNDDSNSQFDKISDSTVQSVETENSHTNIADITSSIQILATINNIITTEEEEDNVVNLEQTQINKTPKTNPSYSYMCLFPYYNDNSNTTTNSPSVASETSNDSSVISNILTALSQNLWVNN